ncbi:TPA: hypothetical protein ACOEGO_003928 [Enterobacter mori]
MHLMQGQCAVNHLRQDLPNIVVHDVDTEVLPGGANAYPAYLT